MGFRTLPKKARRASLVCERDIKDIHFTIVEDTEIRLTDEDIDLIAHKIHDDIKELGKHVQHVIVKKIAIGRKEVFYAANRNSANDWIIKISDPLEFVC